MSPKASLLASLVWLTVLGTLPACGGDTNEPAQASAAGELREDLPVGRYVAVGRPTLPMYLARLTLKDGGKYEADLVQSGTSRLSRGSYVLFPAEPNDPHSPVKTDKPWIALQAESGPSPSFEFDRAADGGLTMYVGARRDSFTMKVDSSPQTTPTGTGKTITCTGPIASATLAIERGDTRAATLALVGKDEDARHPVPTATVSMLLVPARETGVPDWVRYEGRAAGRDYSFRIKKDGFDRGAGAVRVAASFAEDGQEHDIGLNDCSF